LTVILVCPHFTHTTPQLHTPLFLHSFTSSSTLLLRAKKGVNSSVNKYSKGGMKALNNLVAPLPESSKAYSQIKALMPWIGWGDYPATIEKDSERLFQASRLQVQ
jgi:hypothetical protein